MSPLVLLLISHSIASNPAHSPATMQAAPAVRQAPKGLLGALRARRPKAPAGQLAPTHGVATMPMDGSEASELRPEHLQLSKKNEESVGRAEDFSWVTGQLYRVHTGGGDVWVVRYATLDSEDIFGGSIVLAPTVDLRNYRDGDVVCVHGGVLDPNRGARLGGALYRPDTITMVERAD